MLGQALKNSNYQAQENILSKIGKNLALKNIIKVPAASFFEGNLNASNHEFGKGIVIDGGGGFGFAQYEILIPVIGDYEVWVYYASNFKRPIDLYLDGVLLISGALVSATGGWKTDSLKWLYLKTINLSAGKHILRIFTNGLIPHLHTFALIKRNKIFAGLRHNSFSEENGPVPISIFDKIKVQGAKDVLFRAVKHLYLKKPLSDYLDILGIFNGKRAFKGPFHAQIDLTDYCNNNCLACWCNSPLLEEKKHALEQKHALPFELAKELIDDLCGMGTREIYFSGSGEPFCHPRIMDILAYAKKKGFVCYVNTNFTLLDKDKINQLIALGVDHLTVSTWASTADTYAKTHPNKTKDSFRQICENLKYLNATKKNKPYIKLYNVIFSKNYHELVEMVDFARLTGSESLEYTLVDTIPGKTESLLLNSCQIEQLQNDVNKLSLMIDKHGKIGEVTLFRFDAFKRRVSCANDLAQATYDRNIIDKMPCYIGWCFARILPNGDVNSCLKAHRIPAGNLYLNDFKQIWNGDQQTFFRNKTLVYKKSDPFFRQIGNDPDIKEAGCYKSCDDIGRNAYIHNRINALTFFEKVILKTLSKIKFSFPKQSQKRPLQGDSLLAGIEDGRRVFVGPEQVTIDLTNRCNQRCIGCWMYSPFLKNKPDSDLLKQELSLATVKSLIKSLAKMGTKRLRFTGGGEPFMHPSIMEIIAYTKENGLICGITTNFTLLDKPRIKELIKLGVDELAISLWAATAQGYQKTHPQSQAGLFDRLKENIVFLTQQKKDKPYVTICNVLSNINYQQIELMFDFALDCQADGIYFTLLDALEGTDSLLLTQEQSAYLLAKAELILNKWKRLSKEKRIKLDNFDGFISRLKNGQASCGSYDLKDINAYPCYAGWIFSRILANGNVAPCCRGVKKVMGNINLEDFSQIWHKPDYNLFRAKARYLDKSDSYFSEIGCLKMCDNLMHNREVHKRINGK
jgi:MoaA/NifB/PqqE/SkfB family radical SAM enzyme